MNRFFVCLAAALFLLGFTAPLAPAFPQYYSITDISKAQAEARQRNLPLAWLGSFNESLTVGAPDPGSVADLTQMALATLQDNAVVIFFDGRSMNQVPDFIHAQFHIHDDSGLKGDADWISPKVVFSDPGITKILGRVSYTEMKADRDIPLNSAIQIIRNNPAALVPAPVSAQSAPNGQPGMPVLSGEPGQVIVKAYGPSATKSPDAAPIAVVFLKLVNSYGVFLAVFAVVGVVLLTTWIVSARRR